MRGGAGRPRHHATAPGRGRPAPRPTRPAAASRLFQEPADPRVPPAATTAGLQVEDTSASATGRSSYAASAVSAHIASPAPLKPRQRVPPARSATGPASSPDPADLLTAEDHRLLSYGIAPHRVANVLGLARAFMARPDRYDEITLRALQADEVIARVAELPHIGGGASQGDRVQRAWPR
jgi:hypothetical protein